MQNETMTFTCIEKTDKKQQQPADTKLEYNTEFENVYGKIYLGGVFFFFFFFVKNKVDYGCADGSQTRNDELAWRQITHAQLMMTYFSKITANI